MMDRGGLVRCRGCRMIGTLGTIMTSGRKALGSVYLARYGTEGGDRSRPSAKTCTHGLTPDHINPMLSSPLLFDLSPTSNL